MRHERNQNMKTTKKITTLFTIAAIALLPLSAAQVANAADVTATISPSNPAFIENAPTPAFTVTTPALVTNVSYSGMTIVIQTPPPGFPITYWAVNAACTTTDSVLSACKINSVKVNGQEVAGVQVRKNSPTEGLRLTFPNAVATGSTVTVSFDAGAFTAAAAKDYLMRISPAGNGTDPAKDESGTVTLTSVASGGGGGGGGGSTTPSASITLGAAQGQLVAGSSVAIVANGLQAAAPYSVIVESTPQLLTPANATATNGAVNTTVTLPSNLGAGWHTLTFSSTAADGSAVTSVLYFEISSTGTLLGTSTTKPATLAQTGFDGLPLTAAALALLILGAGSTVLARRRRTS